MIVRYWVDALADIGEIFIYQNERNPAGARNVLYAIFDGINDIAEQPLASRQVDEFGVRVRILTRYRYNIFYSIDGDVIDVIHIRHSRGDPGPSVPSAAA